MGEPRRARALSVLRRAFGTRLFIGTPAQPRPALPDGHHHDDPRRDRLHGASLIYVHSKVAIFDDAAAIVSSANLNGRSFRWNTEAGVFLNAPNSVVDLRQRLMAHWMPRDAGPAAFDLTSAVGTWTEIAEANTPVHPAARRGFLLPYDHADAERFGRHMPIIPDEMV